MSDKIKIEHGIPIPSTKRKEKGFWLKLLSEMKPGDSFFVPGSTNALIQCIIYRAKKEINVKTTVRKAEGDVESG